ncbi:MAG: IS200/IS605 family transposase [Acidobacteria bacterium]|nr:IS200/IS605 family transposase [Acidobacteriota bacterium]
MAHTFTQITLHFVFSSKGRACFLKKPLRDRLFPYMVRIVNEEFGQVREIGGTEDHVHLLTEISKDVSAANLMRDLKSRSSGWVHREFDLPGFGWQEGYGAFSVSMSAIDRVREYIRGQEAHHRRMSFQEEFLRMLQRHGIEYDEKYIWK